MLVVRNLTLVFLVLVIELAPAESQLTRESSSQSPVSFKTRTELVLIPTVVTAKGNYVRGLGKKDFDVSHDGTREAIAVFDEVDAVKPEIVSHSIDHRVAQNYTTGNGHQDIVILLLDYLNASWSTSARIRSFMPEISQYLKETRTATTVLVLSPQGLVEVHSFTSDIGDLSRAVEIWSSTVPLSTDKPVKSIPTWISPTAVTSSSITDFVLREFAVWQRTRNIERAETTERAMKQIAEAFRGLPGRKKLMWLTTGFPLREAEPPGDLQSVLSEFRIGEREIRAWKALSGSNISVYPIDSNGVVNPSWNSQFSPEHGSESLAPPPTYENPTNTPSLLAAAKMTGGVTCVSNVLTDCVVKGVIDGQHYYILGFYLRGDEHPGWHRLGVSVARPGVAVRSREGFLLSADTIDTTEGFARDAIQSALEAPLDYTSVPLQLQWRCVAKEGTKSRVEVILFSPPGGLSINNKATASLNVDVLVSVRLPGKSESLTFPASLVSKLSPEEGEDFAAKGFLFRKQLVLPARQYELRVVLRDNTSQKIGTASISMDLSMRP